MALRKFVIVLGGMGFMRGNYRAATAVWLATNNPDTAVVTTGMGEPGRTERDWTAEYLAELLPREQILVGRHGDPIHRDLKDDIRQGLYAIPWKELGGAAELIFPTEGRLHAFRVRCYAKLQLPKGAKARITCVDTGGEIPLERRWREVVSCLKLLRAVLCGKVRPIALD